MKKGYIKLIIKLLIVVIIPLLAGVFTGIYAYGNYEGDFYQRYYVKNLSEENTEDRLVGYLKYITEELEYSKEDGKYDFYYSKDVTNDKGDALFTLSIIRGLSVEEDKPQYNKKGTLIGYVDYHMVSYYIAMYNINYENVLKTLDPSGEQKLLYTEIPTFSFEVIDKNNEENTYKFSTSTVATVSGASSTPTTIYDYGYAPEKDSEGNKLNGGNPTSMRYFVLGGASLSSSKITSGEAKLVVTASTNFKQVEENEEVNNITEEVLNVSFEDLYDNDMITDVMNGKKINEDLKAEINAFKESYNNDIYAAGYNKYVFTRYIWWEALIAILLFEVVCASFVLVWNSEEQKTKKK